MLQRFPNDTLEPNNKSLSLFLYRNFAHKTTLLKKVIPILYSNYSKRFTLDGYYY